LQTSTDIIYRVRLIIMVKRKRFTSAIIKDADYMKSYDKWMLLGYLNYFLRKLSVTELSICDNLRMIQNEK